MDTRLDRHTPTTRIAPTPSGHLHAGNIFSALVAWLYARAHDGEVVLRIDDLDSGRCREEFADSIRRDLSWLGIDWDREAPRQSSRTERYHEVLTMLEKRGLLYPCFCSRSDIHAASAPHAEDGRVVYPGTCRPRKGSRAPDNLPAAADGRMPSIRVIVSDDTLVFRDLIRGVTHIELADDFGDFVVERSDGVFCYQLATAVDDLDQGVDCIVRGHDLITSTAPQLYLRSFISGVPMDDLASRMTFIHHGLLTTRDGHRFAKREHATALSELQNALPTPESLLGWLAHQTGLVPADAPTELNCDDLLDLFDLELLRGRPGIQVSPPQGMI